MSILTISHNHMYGVDYHNHYDLEINYILYPINFIPRPMCGHGMTGIYGHGAVMKKFGKL